MAVVDYRPMPARLINFINNASAGARACVFVCA